MIFSSDTNNYYFKAMFMVLSESLSRYYEMPIHSMDNRKEIKYREKIQPHENTFKNPENWIKAMRKEKYEIPILLKENVAEFNGRILEIGAGSCWLSSVLSKFPKVQEVYALDFSRRILTEIAPRVMDHLKADASKIVRVRGSFYDLRRLGKQFDFVVCDETLHHADYPIILLKQICKVLSEDGLLISIREPIAPKLPILKFVGKRIFGFREKRLGVTENNYTLNEWHKLFRLSGFAMTCYTLHPTSENLSINSFPLMHNLFSCAFKIVFGVNSNLVAFVAKGCRKTTNLIHQS
jgi:2-polyprenyl-3-methyl-5-hydroxy-6-metoxy-1,4-benzoquinol methylase